LFVESHSHLSVDHFAVAGKIAFNTLSFLYTEGWLGAGENPADWVEQKDRTFRFGVGAVRRRDGGQVKWNFAGSGFTLWSPQGPDYGAAEVWLDGALVATVDLHAVQSQPSQPVFRQTGLADAFHTLILQSRRGRLVVDSLDVVNL